VLPEPLLLEAAGVAPPVGPAFSGFNFTFTTGNFWEYRWDYDYSNSEGGFDADTGKFWVVLGPATTIQGINAYALQIYGKSKKRESSSTRSFGPQWRYIAINNNRIMGSSDGLTLKTIFDAQTGKWAGGGFFTSFPNNLIVAQAGTINSANPFISGSAVVIGRSANQSLCEIIEGQQICTGSYSQSLREYEYYRPSIGPVGYYYSNSTYFPDPPPMTFNWEHHVGLAASSFTGQTNPLVSENEPDDSAATARSITTTNPIFGTVSQSTLANQGNSVITVNVVPDGGTLISYQTTVEDWYSFTLAATRIVTITLSFEERSDADLDLFLMNSAGTALAATNSYSIHDNLDRNDQHEVIRVNLAAGSYRIGVDGYITPTSAVRYTLQLE
jgi:hypothetical protein